MVSHYFASAIRDTHVSRATSPKQDESTKSSTEDESTNELNLYMTEAQTHLGLQKRRVR